MERLLFSSSPGNPRPPDSTQNCCRGRCRAFRDRNFRRVRTVAEGGRLASGRGFQESSTGEVHGQQGNSSGKLNMVLSEVCGPAGDHPPAFAGLDAGKVERICASALSEPDRWANPLCSDLASLWNRSPAPPISSRATEARVAVAVFLERHESPEIPNTRFSNLSAVSYALAKADAENLDYVVVSYVVVSTASAIRLYPVREGVGIGRRGRTETFVEIHLDLISNEQAGYLWLLLSADALRRGRTIEEILDSSARYAVALGNRLRERVYTDAVPPLGPGEEVDPLLRAVDKGNAEWGVPAYNGGLFSRDPAVSAAGAARGAICMPDLAFGPVLQSLLVDNTPEGGGPVGGADEVRNSTRAVQRRPKLLGSPRETGKPSLGHGGARHRGNRPDHHPGVLPGWVCGVLSSRWLRPLHFQFCRLQAAMAGRRQALP